jgi:hypothetical protein
MSGAHSLRAAGISKEIRPVALSIIQSTDCTIRYMGGPEDNGENVSLTRCTSSHFNNQPPISIASQCVVCANSDVGDLDLESPPVDVEFVELLCSSSKISILLAWSLTEASPCRR